MKRIVIPSYKIYLCDQISHIFNIVVVMQRK
jgi:hypothetical protein